jgi:phenylalanyl-tRNA synthetase beta chain
MGGEESGCTAETRNVFLEVAVFDPKRTASTGRRLGIESDARYRFERGIDQAMVMPGAEYATRLILDLCGGEASRLVVAGAPDLERRTVSFRPGRVAALGGMTVDEDEQRRILGALGFAVTGEGERWQVAAPTWRTDVDGEACLVEEVTRIAGFDRLPSTPLPRLSVVSTPALTVEQRRRPMAKRALAERGMLECVTWSFLPQRVAELFGGGRDDLRLSNPISSELDAMRPSLLGHLIRAAGRNADRGYDDVALFEVGPQYADPTPQGQAMMASGIRRGMTAERHWSKVARPVDVYDAKADALAVLAAVGAPVASLQVAAEAPAGYHPGRSGVLRLGPKNMLAWFGELHPQVLERLDVAGPLVGMEVFLDSVPLPKGKGLRTRPKLEVSDFPAVRRDFAFLLDADVDAEQVLRAARGADKNLIASVDVFDVYAGKGIPEGQKSIAITMRLEPRDRTLTDPEIDAVADKVVAAVGKATGATLRG